MLRYIKGLKYLKLIIDKSEFKYNIEGLCNYSFVNGFKKASNINIFLKLVVSIPYCNFWSLLIKNYIISSLQKLGLISYFT